MLIRCQGFLKGLRLCHIIRYLTVFITACYYQFELFTQSSVIFDIGLCLRSSSSSSLTVVALQNFSLSHFRHRTLSEVVVEFIAYSCRFAKLFAQPFSTSDFVWGRRRVYRLQLSLCKTFRSAIFDIGLCLRSSSSSSLTVVALQNFSLSHFRHRTLSEVVVEFIAYSCRFSELFAQSSSTSDFVRGRRRVHRWCCHLTLNWWPRRDT